MTELESTNQVTDDLWAKITYLCKEYDISVARMIGILQIVQYGLYEYAKDKESNGQ